MKTHSTITTKGQVTIPNEIRRKLGVKPGQTVYFELQDNKVFIKTNDWQKQLKNLSKKVASHMKKKGLQSPSIKELEKARENYWKSQSESGNRKNNKVS